MGLVVCGIADDELLGGGDKTFDEAIKNRTFDKNAAAGAAILACVGKDAHRCGRGGLVDVGIGKDNVRRLATKFEGYTLQVVRGEFHDARADGG